MFRLVGLTVRRIDLKIEGGMSAKKKVKSKTVQQIVASGSESQRFVLVGTYKREPDQLKWIRKRHLYNYPLSEEETKASSDGWSKVKELWLYSGSKDRRHIYAAEFVGIKTRKEFMDDHPDYPKGRGKHGDFYVVFRVKHKYQPTIEDSQVVVRIRDFTKRTPKIAKAIKSYQDGGELGNLLTYLPSELTPLTRDQLRVCDPAMQLSFWDLPNMVTLRPSVPFPPPKEFSFTFIDLFAGMGGFRLAMEAQGGKCVFSSEWNKYAQKTYEANFGEVPYGDITQEDTKKEIPEHFDVLCAGFPCQPFSIAGVSKKNSLGRATGFKDKTQGTLFFDVADIISRHRPKAFFLENVKNLLSHDKGNTFRVIRETLEELEYSIHYRVMDGQAYVPQHRERIMIVGFDTRVFRGAEHFDFPSEHDAQHRVSDILEDTPDPKYTLSDKLWNYLQNYAKKHQAKGNGFGFGMVDLNGVTRTLSARYYKDGSEILIPQGKGVNPRRLTPHECAKLMGYPDNYRLDVVSDVQAYKQCGNSVVVPLITAVAHNLIETINA